MNLVATRWWSMLFMPSCVLMAGIAVGLAWCLWSWRRGKSPRQAWPAVALATGSAFLLYLASTPLVARWAAWTLERGVPAIAVVLGRARKMRCAAGHDQRLCPSLAQPLGGTGSPSRPLPSDFSTRGAQGWSWALLVPRGLALAQVDGVAKEWMGRVAGGG